MVQVLTGGLEWREPLHRLLCGREKQPGLGGRDWVGAGALGRSYLSGLPVRGELPGELPAVA